MTRPRRLTAAAASAALGAIVVSSCAVQAAGPAPTDGTSSTLAAPPAEDQAAATLGATGDGVRTLAKVDGWRVGLVTPPYVYSALEVAYDPETAQRLWEENVPPDLPAQEGDPTRVGVYGDLAGVDFDEQAVALWSGGQSGSCPGWLSAVRLAEAARVLVTEDQDSGATGACTADRNVYRTVVVIDRGHLPSEHGLGSAQATDDDVDYPAEVLLTAYPAP